MLYYENPQGKLYHGDCLELMKNIPDGSVDMILCDLPYGITERCKWDTKIPLAPLWDQWGRILKENGAVCLTAQQPFVTELINSTKRPFRFRYELIWEKSKACGFLNANRMPLRAHENIFVFYRKMPRYMPQMSEGSPYRQKGGREKKSSIYRSDGKKRQLKTTVRDSRAACSASPRNHAPIIRPKSRRPFSSG